MTTAISTVDPDAIGGATGVGVESCLVFSEDD
jgi:hypothetical protein